MQRVERYLSSSLLAHWRKLLQFQKQLHPEGDVLASPIKNAPNKLMKTEVKIPENVPSMQKENLKIVPSMVVNEDLTSITIPETVPSLTPSLEDNNIKNKCSTLKKNQNCFSRGKLLLQHSTEQAKLLTDISNSLGSIKRKRKT